MVLKNKNSVNHFNEAPEYIYHLDGIRGIAVLLVVLFHLKIPFFQGGYVGVDVFFVISGFIVTRNILDQMDRGSFALKRFYAKRFVRLMPAHITAVFATAIISELFLSPLREIELLNSAIFSLTGVSNLYFLSRLGYFDSAAVEKPLLHTWSLSVEEQFYLFWPLLLALMTRITTYRSNAFMIISAFFYISTLLVELFYRSSYQKSILFFVVAFRVHQFSLGSVCLYLRKGLKTFSILSDAVSVTGLFLILFSLRKFEGEERHYLMIIPSVGAAALISAGDKSFLRGILNSKFLSFFGRISYSIYLVHWPLVSFSYYISFSEATSFQKSFQFMLTLILGSLLFYAVENPIRKARSSRYIFRKQLLLYLFFISSLVIFRQCLIKREDSFAKYQGSDDRYKRVVKLCSVLSPIYDPRCNWNAEKQVLIYGNSHVADAGTILHTIFENDKNVNLILYGSTNDCALVYGNGTGLELVYPSRRARRSKKCKKLLPRMQNETFLKTFTHFIDAQFIRFEEWDFKDHIVWLFPKWVAYVNPNIQFVHISNFVELRVSCSEIYWRYKETGFCLDKKYVFYQPFDPRLSSKNLQFPLKHLLLNSTRILCENTGLRLKGELNCITAASGYPFSFDRDHFTRNFAELYARRAWKIYQEELSKIGLIPSKDKEVIASKKRSNPNLRLLVKVD